MKLKMNFVSPSMLMGKPAEKRIDFILENVEKETILVLSGVLRPEEEMKLISETMRRVNNGFPGIEICSLRKKNTRYKTWLRKVSSQTYKVQSFLRRGKAEVFNSKLDDGITLIGPSKIIKKIKRNPYSFLVLAEV